MATLSEYNAIHNGKIIVGDPIEYKILNKLPHGIVEITFRLGIEYGKFQTQPNQKIDNVGYKMEGFQSSISYQSIPVTQNFPFSRSIDPTMIDDVKCAFALSPVELEFVESKRADDIVLSISLIGNYSAHLVDHNQQISIQDSRFQLHIPWKFSQKEWTKFLSDIGYNEKWIIEVDRPKLEGFHEVLEFIEKAQRGLIEKASPDVMISDLRSAWDRLDPFIKRFDSEIKKLVNSGSNGEKSEPDKFERIEKIAELNARLINDLIELRKATDKLTQIGPHKESYVSTIEDALLSFRLTVSLMSYYSKFLARIAKGE